MTRSPGLGIAGEPDALAPKTRPATGMVGPATRRRALLTLALALAALALLAPPAAAKPVAVEVGIHVISVGNYDANKGTYTMDMYLVLRWDPAAAPANFSASSFEFMNGRASSKELLSDGPAGGMHESWWRIQANLFTEPTFRDYPFDVQTLTVQLEDAVHTSDLLAYVPDDAGIALDPDAHVAGWRVRSESAATANKTYPFGETYSRFTYQVEVERPALGVGLRAFVPPAGFVLVAGVAFFLHPSKVANRLSLGTSMVISAVGFHVSQVISLPSLPRLTLFDEVMISVYVFLACSLGATTLIAVNEDHWKREGLTRKANVWGAVVTCALAAVTFLLLRAM